MRKQKLSVIQKDLIIGSLLGDGYLMPTTCGCRFRAHHGIKQKDYLDWKYSILKNIFPHIIPSMLYKLSP